MVLNGRNVAHALCVIAIRAAAQRAKAPPAYRKYYSNNSCKSTMHGRRIEMKKCLYCGKAVDQKHAYNIEINNDAFYTCSFKCKTKTEEYIENNRKKRVILYMVMFLVFVGHIVLLIFEELLFLVYIIQLLAGITIYLLPYPVKSYKKLHNGSIRKLVKICRGVGAYFAIFGMLMTIIMC